MNNEKPWLDRNDLLDYVPQIHHFYHIYADGKWEEPVEEHIRALKMGLYENLGMFFIGIVGSVENRNRVKIYLDLTGLKYFIAAEADSGWEQATMIPMWEHARFHNGQFLYAHTKGAYDPNPVNQRWRRSMTYWCVVRWKDCIERLKDHGAVGNHWIQPLLTGMPEHRQGNFMMAGTMYWVRAELLRTFPAPALTHRHEAEGFIGYGWHAKPFPVYDFSPYFPNSGPFADDWVNNPEFVYEDAGRSIPVPETIQPIAV